MSGFKLHILCDMPAGWFELFNVSLDSLEGLPRSACKRPKLDVSLDEWDLSGLPWWFLGNLRSNYSRKSNGSTDIHTNQVRTVTC